MTLQETLQLAAQKLQERLPEQALAVLEPQRELCARVADFWQLLALAYKGMGDSVAAEAAFTTSIAIDPQPHVLTNLANLHRSLRQAETALGFYDQALALAPDHLPAQINRGRALLDLSRNNDARLAFQTILQAKPGHRNATLGLAQASQQIGEQEHALGLFQSVLEGDPDNTVALNGMGVSLKTLGYIDDAVNYLQVGAQHAPESPELFTNLASALAQADREDEAVAAYNRALELSPYDLDLHDWFNGYLGVIAHPQYLDSYRRVLEQQPANGRIATALARKLLLNGCGSEAQAILEAAKSAGGERALLEAELSHVCREQGLYSEALESVRSAMRLAPGDPSVQRELATTLMAAGEDYGEALQILDDLLQRYPEDQGLWALCATALRYTENTERYARLVDYDHLVQVRSVRAPDEFKGLTAFLAFLRDSLNLLHTTQRHPVEQSAVNGTQTLDDLFSRRHHSIELLQQALETQLYSVLQNLPVDDAHPLLGRNTGGLRFSDSWSIRLRDQGYHKNHFHSQGWLSSAFYLRVPDSINYSAAEGWIKFGEPGFKAREQLSAEYWILPREGTLVVFPSYLWHGTEPLSHTRERMSVGYDILPS
ncbi:tetratricopeptide repeat protein [Luminiphilus sp. nBUS_16]|uniref:tetratricopeptide repeat protein n=1 Tax=Luminiphilus sp. nBUS_16 TaxID=3395315 RepID=UPI003EBFFD63